MADIGTQASDALKGARQSTSDAASAAAAAATQSVKDVAGQVKSQAVDVTQKAVSQLKEHGQRAVMEQKDRTATTLTDVGNALQKAADRLRQESDDNIASYIDAIAGLSNKAGTYLRDADVSSLTGDVTRMARRNPGLFLGGMFVAGLALARFAKASQPDSARRTGSPGRAYGYDAPYDPAYEDARRRYTGPGNYNQAGAFTDPDEYPGARAASHIATAPTENDLIGGAMPDVPTSGIGATPISPGSGSISGVGTGTGSMSGSGASNYDSSSLSSNPINPATPGSGTTNRPTGGGQ
jgi:hypothetical protein